MLSMDTLMHFLASIHPLSDELQAHLRKILKKRQIAKKDYLLKAGEVSRHVCFIMQGLLRCFYEKGNREVSCWFMKEGDVVFSIGSFYTQTPSYQSIQALENTSIFYIEHEELEYIYKTFPEFNYVGRVLTIKYHILWDQQQYSLRMRTADEKYQLLLDNDADLLQRVPAKYLASYLGIAEITLSKIRGKRKK